MLQKWALLYHALRSQRADLSPSWGNREVNRAHCSLELLLDTTASFPTTNLSQDCHRYLSATLRVLSSGGTILGI